MKFEIYKNYLVRGRFTVEAKDEAEAITEHEAAFAEAIGHSECGAVELVSGYDDDDSAALTEEQIDLTIDGEYLE